MHTRKCLLIQDSLSKLHMLFRWHLPQAVQAAFSVPLPRPWWGAGSVTWPVTPAGVGTQGRDTNNNNRHGPDALALRRVNFLVPSEAKLWLNSHTNVQLHGG